MDVIQNVWNATHAIGSILEKLKGVPTAWRMPDTFFAGYC